MLEPIKKLRRTYDDGTGTFYYSDSNEKAQSPLSEDDILRKLDQAIDRLNLLSTMLSAILKPDPTKPRPLLPDFLIVKPGEETEALRLLDAQRTKNKRKEKL